MHIAWRKVGFYFHEHDFIAIFEREVFEWVNDWYGNYTADAETNPTGPPSGSFRVSRGGNLYSETFFCRVSCRYYIHPDFRYSELGFRLALS